MFETSIKNLKILNIKNLKKTLSLSIVCSSCGYECGRIFKGEASTEILKIIGLINNIEDYQKYVIMSEENVSQEFRLKNLDETRNYWIEEINRNELMSKRTKRFVQLYIILNTFLF